MTNYSVQLLIVFFFLSLNDANCHLPSKFFVLLQECSCVCFYCILPHFINVISHLFTVFSFTGTEFDLCEVVVIFKSFCDSPPQSKNCGYAHHRRLCNATGEKSCFTTFLRGILYFPKQSKILAHVLHSPLFLAGDFCAGVI